jgi:hypothetical protein
MKVCPRREVEMARKKLEVVEVSERLKALGRKEKWTPEEGAFVVKELAVYRGRGATLAAFARGMGVTPQRIRNWRDGRNPGARRVRRRVTGDEPSFVPVKVVPEAAPVGARTEEDPSRMEIGLAGGRSVRVGAGFDAGAVARLVATLEQLGC